MKVKDPQVTVVDFDLVVQPLIDPRDVGIGAVKVLGAGLLMLFVGGSSSGMVSTLMSADVTDIEHPDPVVDRQ